MRSLRSGAVTHSTSLSEVEETNVPKRKTKKLKKKKTKKVKSANRSNQEDTKNNFELSTERLNTETYDDTDKDKYVKPLEKTNQTDVDQLTQDLSDGNPGRKKKRGRRQIKKEVKLSSDEYENFLLPQNDAVGPSNKSHKKKRKQIDMANSESSDNNTDEKTEIPQDVNLTTSNIKTKKKRLTRRNNVDINFSSDEISDGLSRKSSTKQELKTNKSITETANVTFDKKSNSTFECDKKSNSTFECDKKSNSTFDCEKKSNSLFEYDKTSNSTFEGDKKTNSTFEVEPSLNVNDYSQMLHENFVTSTNKKPSKEQYFSKNNSRISCISNRHSLKRQSNIDIKSDSDHTLIKNSVSHDGTFDVETSSDKTDVLKVPKSKNYEKLDDITDEVLDIIEISDDSLKIESRRSTFNISKKTPSKIDTTEDEDRQIRRETFDLQERNQSGQWKVENLTKSINKTPENSDSKSINKTPENSETNGKAANTAINYIFDSPIKNVHVLSNIKSKPDETLNRIDFVKSGFHSANMSRVNENMLTPSKDPKRKKWLKFAIDSPGAISVLEQINSPQLKTKNVSFASRRSTVDTTPLKTSFAEAKAGSSKFSARKSTPYKPITNKEAKSSTKQDLRSSSKRTALPNFALIHQRAFEKMESLKEYSERKNQRAKMLLSSGKGKATGGEKENSKQKSSRQLFSNDPKPGFNRFGFKDQNVPVKKPLLSDKKSNTPTFNRFGSTSSVNNSSGLSAVYHKKFGSTSSVIKSSSLFSVQNNVQKYSIQTQKSLQTKLPVQKEKVPIFSRSNLTAAANKNKVQDLNKNRDNRRDILKGVRTNKRFELLMKMRKNQ